MRKLAIMLGLAMLLVMVAAGAAIAVTKTCNNIPCEGTNNDDVLHERTDARKDAIFGKRGEDLIDANNRFRDRDRLFGGRQGDKLLANDLDSRDALRGGAGRDRCYGDPGDRFVNCEVKRRLGPSAAAADF